MTNRPYPPPSPLEPQAGEPGYVPSVLVVDTLGQALDLAASQLDWSDPVTQRLPYGAALARDTLRDAATLVDVLQRRLTTGALIDARRSDQEASE